MPFKTDKIAIGCPFMDRRTKLLPCQKEMVIYWRNKGLSQRQLASKFNVSRRLIIFITDPEKHLLNLKARDERGGSKVYYVKDQHTKSIREHRNYKYKSLKHTL